MTTKLDRQSLREQILARIRSEIMAGELEQDEIYSARTLAARFGVSSTPVREAMMDLEGIGLVTPVPNRGFRVVPVRDGDIREIAELRTMLEVPLVGKAALGATASEVEHLNTLVDRLDDELEREDIVGFLETDRELHIAYAQLSRISRAPALVALLRDQVRVSAVPELVRVHALDRAVADHRDIVRAISERNSDVAMKTLAEHLHASVETLVGRTTGSSKLRPM
jgi:DNA-binding GntR family transcriptional regulator